jgi:hypothetical protein
MANERERRGAGLNLEPFLPSLVPKPELGGEN